MIFFAFSLLAAIGRQQKADTRMKAIGGRQKDTDNQHVAGCNAQGQGSRQEEEGSYIRKYEADTCKQAEKVTAGRKQQRQTRESRQEDTGCYRLSAGVPAVMVFCLFL